MSLTRLVPVLCIVAVLGLRADPKSRLARAKTGRKRPEN
jgi:hypothetical protein